jgi:hypothetical protein
MLLLYRTGVHTGVSIPGASIQFALSQLLVVDEAKCYWRVNVLDYYDFLEALCRIAMMVRLSFSLPGVCSNVHPLHLRAHPAKTTHLFLCNIV